MNTASLAIEISNLTYRHNTDLPSDGPALSDVSLKLPRGSRTILIGANGGESHIQCILLYLDIRLFQPENQLFYKFSQENVSPR